MVGLIRAIDKFDTDREISLSTYAVPWIRYQIERFIMKNRNGVDAPESMLKQMNKVAKAKSRLTKFFGRNPSFQEMAYELDMPIEEVVAIDSLTNCTQSDWDPVREASIADSTADEHDLVEQVEAEQMAEALGRAFDTLTDVDRDLIRGRYGLGSADVVTLEELARRHRLSVRQVRSRVDKAMEKLKQHFVTV
jgi:RNA polymerase sigma factor (sigma-70 family)